MTYYFKIYSLKIYASFTSGHSIPLQNTLQVFSTTETRLLKPSPFSLLIWIHLKVIKNSFSPSDCRQLYSENKFSQIIFRNANIKPFSTGLPSASRFGKLSAQVNLMNQFFSEWNFLDARFYGQINQNKILPQPKIQNVKLMWFFPFYKKPFCSHLWSFYSIKISPQASFAILRTETPFRQEKLNY